MKSKTIQTDAEKAVDNRGIFPYIFNFLRILLGLLFIITGISKFLVLGAFSTTIGQLLPSMGQFSLVIALIVISLESLCGVALLANKYRRSAILLLLGLTLSFTYFLAIAIISQHPFICNCFGIIPLTLSNSNELVLNFIILDSLLIVFLRDGWNSKKKDIGMKWIYVTLAAGFMYVQYTAGSYILERDVSNNPVNLMKVNSFLSNYHQYSPTAPRSTHIVLIRISDFNCPPCFNDFIGYTQLINHYYDPTHNAFQIVGLVEQSGALTDSISIYAWGKANNILFPLIPVPENIFREFNFSKSCVVYQWPSGRARYIYTFPGADSDRNKLMSAFSY